MSTIIDPVETYYQTFLKKLLHILPYAALFIIVIQIIIQKLKHYLIAKLSEFFNFIFLLFNCIIEDGEPATSFDSQLEIENRQVDECHGKNSGACKTVDEKINSFGNAIVSSQNFDDSLSDIEMLRGDSEEETDEEKEKKLAESIEVKRVLLQNKRHELCGRLLAYKLMEFHVDGPQFDVNHSLNLPIPTFLRTKSESPIPVAEEIDVHEVPNTPASPPQIPPPFFPDDEESYSFSCEDMLARAIQASLDDLVTKQVHDSSLTPPREESSTAKLPGQPSTEAAYKDTSAPSPSKINLQQSIPTRPNRSHQLTLPVVNFSDTWNKNYSQDVGDPGIQQGDSDHIVTEDFMEGDRYVGDKGKRPQSGRYAYKKRVKPSKSETEEQSPSGSVDVPKKDLTR